MRKKMGLIALVALFGVAMQGLVSPAMAAPKVDICHVNSANDVFDFGVPLGILAFGRVKSVNENALPAHENHGDSLGFGELTPDDRDITEAILGITLPNANCFFFVPAV